MLKFLDYSIYRKNNNDDLVKIILFANYVHLTLTLITTMIKFYFITSIIIGLI